MTSLAKWTIVDFIYVKKKLYMFYHNKDYVLKYIMLFPNFNTYNWS